MKAMTVYQAIKKMRELSKAGQSFSFSYMSYSMDRRASHGIVEVRRARLERASTQEQNRHADIMLNYWDMDLMENRRCYQPLLMTFEGQNLELGYERTENI